MSNTTSTRVTLASTNARIDELTELLAKAVTLFSAGSHMTAPAVVDITSAPSKRVRKATTSKATKSAPRTSAVAQEVVSIEEATRLAHTGVNPWTIKVTSATTGKPVPFFRVAKALKIELPKYVRTDAVAPVSKPATKATAKKATKAAPAGANALLGKTGAELAAMGTTEAQAEIARRAAKRAAKAASK